MQLKNALLATAAGSLIGTSAAQSAEWEHEASALYYQEDNDRVTDASIKYKGVRTKDNGDNLTLNAAFDTLSGASPSGIAKSTSPQTVTSPSGKETTTIVPGELPKEDNFQDKRLSLSATANKILDRDNSISYGLSFSNEYDYMHMGINVGYSRTLNQKNTTLAVGFAFSNDSISAEGSIPTALNTPDNKNPLDDQTKQVTAIMLGATQVLRTNIIAQFNYGLSNTSGYLNDPYKYVSTINALGEVVENRYESRPDTRLGHNLYAAVNWKLHPKITSSTGLRYHTDDWEITSITLDQKLRFDLGNGKSIEPHLRYYKQTAADFYTQNFGVGAALPQYASADYRLAEFDAITAGFSYRWKGKKDRLWRVTAEAYQQTPKYTNLSNEDFTAAIFSIGVKLP